MDPELPVLKLIRILRELFALLFGGENAAPRLAWLRDALAAVLHLAGSFPDKFDAKARKRIEDQLKERNYCHQADEMRETWTPQQDWEAILKLVLELVMILVHEYSPNPPEPEPDPDNPDEGIKELARRYVERTIQHPCKFTTAKELAGAMFKCIDEIENTKPISHAEARAEMRKACSPIPQEGIDEWKAFSAFIDAYIDGLHLDGGSLEGNDLIRIWTQIAHGLREATNR